MVLIWICIFWNCGIICVMISVMFISRIGIVMIRISESLVFCCIVKMMLFIVRIGVEMSIV